ncbi:MAG: 2'-5' RNA ligase family protein, partial [Acidobacteriaceae bacterium]|nr:2'-5' RNA ligase family protein [Acidobacteriaceae bacterium]
SLFTLVTYAPQPLQRWMVRLRRELPLERNSQPHLTILPPRPLTMSSREARQKITSILSTWQSFEIELSGVRVFPNSNVLYLEVSEGINTLRRLHAELDSGEFAHNEEFDFHPHVTIGGPIAAEQLPSYTQKAVDRWANSRCPSRFPIDEIAFVTISADRAKGDWRRLWAQKLPAAKSYRRAARAAVTSQTF